MRAGLKRRKDRDGGKSIKGVGKSSKPPPLSPLYPVPLLVGGRGVLHSSPSTPDTQPEAAAINGQVSGHKTLLLCGLLMWSPPGKHLCGQKAQGQRD